METRVEQGIATDLDQLWPSVAHDLRAAVRAILTAQNGLEEGLGRLMDAQAREHQRSAREATRQIVRLVEAVSLFQRLSERELQSAPVDLSDLVAREVLRLRRGDLTREVSLELEHNVRVNGDPDLLAVLIAELVENAWKFTKTSEGATIRFGRVDGGIAISDNGIGIDPEYVGVVFEPFRRLVSRSEYAGAGLGLALADSVVRAHGGTIRVEPCSPGTRIVFSLP